MKKYLIYIWTVMALSVVACDPMDEVYEELDQLPKEGVGVEITLSEDQYDFLIEEGVLTSPFFESVDQAKEHIPLILENDYPHLRAGSTAKVAYNLKSGSTEAADYTNASMYFLSEDDYASAGAETGSAGFFNNTVRAEDYLPSILLDNIQDPADGQLQAVRYEFADVEYEDITGEVVYSETFDDDTSLGPFDVQSVEGAQGWVWDDFSGDGFAKMSGYSGGAVANEDWLVSPEIDLTSLENVTLKFAQAINYLESGVAGEDLKVKISTDYDGNVGTSTWTDLDVDIWPAGDNWTFVNSEADLADFEGEKVRIAFYYTSTADFAATWEVSSIIVESGEIIPTNKVNVFYTWSAEDNIWEEVDQDEVYYLASADYDAMGAPGRFDNFSGSVPAENYIPQFLDMRYPFAQEEDEIVVVYRYFADGSTFTSGNVYTFMAGEWVPSRAVVQFERAAGVWVPDNTINYTLTGSDYTSIAENAELGTQAARDNLSTYGNFNLFSWSDEEILEAIDFILKKHFPASEEGQKYRVAYSSYPKGDISMHVILNADGNYVLVE